ncbi:MAG: hypothetical protein COW65_07845, partial [Cytophagales bacterium CG18_big_fil_WC_8_21_14_2_50_42_9]
MLKNYLKIAWRNLMRHPLYSLINIGGLAVGLAVCMLMMVYVAHERSFDRFHTDAGRIFAVHARLNIGGNPIQFPTLSFTTGPAVQ